MKFEGPTNVHTGKPLPEAIEPGGLGAGIYTINQTWEISISSIGTMQPRQRQKIGPSRKKKGIAIWLAVKVLAVGAVTQVKL